MASFCCVEAQLLGADRGEHLPPAHKGSSRSVSQGRPWNVAGRHGRSRSTDRQGGTWAMREHASVFTFVYGKVGLTPWLFLAWYTEFCPCLMLLRSSKNAKASEHGDSSALLPDPDPPAPTPVGGTSEIPGWRVREAICKKRDGFF